MHNLRFVFILGLCLLCAALTAGCQSAYHYTTRLHGPSADEVADEVDDKEMAKMAAMDAPQLTKYLDDILPEDKISKYDFPVVRNAHVDRWIDYFTGRGREWFQRALNRGARYIPFMQEVLASYDLPQDLVYLSLIESGFMSHAYSRAHAAGQWQFIQATGKRYGLNTSIWVDERRDPIKATEAAAQYLKELYRIFGSWYLAAAAYNSGENRILRAITRFKTRDFWELIKPRHLPRETKNYVPKLIAAIIIAKDLDKYGFETPTGVAPYEYAHINTSTSVDLKKLASLIGIPHDELKRLNSELRHGITPPDIHYDIKVPPRLKDVALANLEKSHATVPSKIFDHHRVRRGDTLYAIARRYNTRVSTLLSLNNMNYQQARRLRVGRNLVVPLDGAHPGHLAALSQTGTHVVRRGENPSRIARRYRVSLQNLRQANNSNLNVIYPGQRLVIPGRGTASAPTVATTHAVRRGENPYQIARRYNISLQNLRQANGSDLRVIHPGQRLVIPGRGTASAATTVPTTHVVRRGENPYQIARRYNISLQELRQANGSDLRVIHPGQRLTIPGRGTPTSQRVHVVRHGDSLWRIARHYNVTLAQIQRANTGNLNVIHPGQRIIIPGG